MEGKYWNFITLKKMSTFMYIHLFRKGSSTKAIREDEIVDVWSLWFLDNIFCLLIIVFVYFRYVKICCPAIELSIKNWCTLFWLTEDGLTTPICKLWIANNNQ